MLIVGPYELADPASIFPKNNKIFFEANLTVNWRFNTENTLLYATNLQPASWLVKDSVLGHL